MSPHDPKNSPQVVLEWLTARSGRADNALRHSLCQGKLRGYRQELTAYNYCFF